MKKNLTPAGRTQKVPTGVEGLDEIAQTNLIASEAVQRRATEMQASILDALPAHIVLLDPAGMILAVNESWRAFAAPNQIQSSAFGVGQNYLEVCERAAGDCADEAGDVALGLRRVLRGELRDFALEYPCHSPTEQRWFRIMVSPVNPDQRAGAVVMHVNITPRRRAEAEIRLQARMLDQVGQAVIATDVQGRITFANRFAGELYGWAPAEMVGRNVIDVTVPTGSRPDTAAILALLQAGRNWSGEFFVQARDGRVFPTLVTTSPLLDERGQLAGVIGISADISERREAQAALEKNEQEQRDLAAQLSAERARLLTAQAVAKVGSWETDLSTLAVIWSEETHRIFEVGREAFRPASHATFLGCVHPDDRAAVAEAFARSAGQPGPHTIEHRVLLPGGRIKFVEERWQVVSGAEGRPARAIGTCQDISSRKQAEGQTRELAARLTTTLESLTEGFITLDVTWHFTYVNREAERLLRRPRTELIGMDVWSNFPAASGTPFHQESKRAMRDQVAVQFEAFYPPFKAWFEVRAFPSPQGLAIYFRDVSEVRVANEALRASDERFQLLSKATKDAIWDWDLGTGSLWWNEGFESLFGFRRDEVEPTIDSWSTRVHPEDREAVIADVHRAIDGGGASWSGEYRFLRKDGRHAFVFDRGYIIRDRAGKAVRMTGSMTDLTERRLLEVELRLQAKQLRLSEEQYRLLFADSPQPMWVYDLETLRFVAVNSAAVAHYGYTEEEFLGLTILEIRPPEEVPAIKARLAIQPLSNFKEMPFRHFKKDGTLLDVTITANAIEFNHRPARLVVVVDVTERLRAERDALRANRALRMLSRSNEALIRATSERKLLTEICEIAVEVGGFRLAWIGFAVDDAEKNIVPQAHAGVDDGYLAAIRLTWADTPPAGQGPAARAIRTGKPIVVADLADGQTGFHSVAEARACGYCGVACLPLKDQGRPFGLMALYLDEVRAVPDDELGLLQELADDLAFGLMNLRARAESRQTHEAVLTMARGVSASVGDEFFEKLTHSMVEALGAQAGFVGRLVPPELNRVRTICAVVAGRTVANFECPLAGTPCANLVKSEFFISPRDAQRLYPEAAVLAELSIEAYVGARLADAAGRPIGVMFVLFQQPLTQSEFVSSTLKIFAARAAAELEREDADIRTREQAALIDEARDAIIVRDLEHRVIFWSKGAERLYGWSAAEAEGRGVVELLRIEAGSFAAAYRTVREAGEWHGEIQKTAKDGIVRTVDSRGTLLRTPDGRPKSILVIDTDVTERKKLEQQFLRAQRMESIGTLAGGIAHDMNNLLAPIVMGVGLLRQFTADEQSLQVIRNIERSARRGTDLVKQVLSFARGVDGARVAIALKHVVHEVEAIGQSTFPKNITFETDAAKDLWLVTGDPTQLNQVLLNLCVNARDAMPDGGGLAITVRNIAIDEQYAVMNRGVAAGRYVRLEVSDTGCGMPQEVVDRIFEPFFTTKEMGKGTGLGLSTVLGIVRSHGGFVNVDSEVGKGSVFKVYLPAQSESGPADPAEPAPRERLPRGEGELILIVDDEAAVRDITQQTLEAFGYRVVTAEDGAQAVGLYALHRQEIAVVLTDMMMPVMDGPALIAALQRIDPAIRIIAASGLHANAGLARIGAGGVKHFLAKPYSAETMLTLLKTVLAEKSP